MKSILCALALLILPATGQEASSARLKVRISWGHRSPQAVPFFVKLVPLSEGVRVENPEGRDLEADEGLREGAWRTRAGNGDVDGVEFLLFFPRARGKGVRPVHQIWTTLLNETDPETAARLRDDPAFQVDPPLLMVQMNPEGTKGFALSVDQLLKHKALWIPSLDVYLSAGEAPVPFADHAAELEAWKGKRILDRVRVEPEASYAQFSALWADMGNPKHNHPTHFVPVSWDSAIPKCAIGRHGEVASDFGNPDRFHLAVDTAGSDWKGQRLEDGLPVLTTVLEREGVRTEIEQFAYPLEGPPSERRGDIAMVFLERLKLTDLAGKGGKVAVRMSHRRECSVFTEHRRVLRRRGDALLLEEGGTQRIMLALEGVGGDVSASDVEEARDDKKETVWRRTDFTIGLDLPAGGSREVLFKMPSPPLESKADEKLTSIDYPRARSVTLKFWSDWLARGARFDVPEKTVNDLFRANLWHALRLPRRHGGPGENVKIDLPYSNIAYGQTGTPWPVNQAVYVDYMLYALRGHHDVATEELLAQYRNNQTPDGHVGGFANWGVYTPGMMYSVAKNFLLSQDRAAFDRLLPATLKALDWCLGEIRKTSADVGPTRGLIRAPLNDLSHDAKVWAFNEAYFYAGFDLLAQALGRIGHARAAECREAARSMREATERAFGAAAARSPIVQLRDHTWIPYVPSEALTPRRIVEQWYPTDVDTGAAHLPRLQALPAAGVLAGYVLHDHEDNLFLKGWGMANEPVYNQQATAYLLRDEPKAAIRAFYSMIACAFSHSVLEPVEHRWGWGQFFGPPSTDGAWFELYRMMLIREREDDTLLLGQATPRAWLEDGKRIEVERAPTSYGNISFTIESRANSGELEAVVRLSEGAPMPGALLVRLRHPQSSVIKSVKVNGQAWTDFDPRNEWVRIPAPLGSSFVVTATY